MTGERPPPTWYLQSGSKTSDGLAGACAAERVPHHRFRSVPFSPDLPDDEPLFLRPDDDLKMTAGGVMPFGEFRRWADGFRGEYGTVLNSATTLLVAAPKTIAASLYAPEVRLALDENGGARIIEANCLNGSGLYACDLRRLVASVGDLP